MKLLKGRQILWSLENEHKLDENDGADTSWEKLLYVELKNGNVEKFLNDWEQVLQSIDINVLNNQEKQFESLLRRQLNKAPQLNLALEMCLKGLLS